MVVEISSLTLLEHKLMNVMGKDRKKGVSDQVTKSFESPFKDFVHGFVCHEENKIFLKGKDINNFLDH